MGKGTGRESWRSVGCYFDRERGGRILGYNLISRYCYYAYATRAHLHTYILTASTTSSYDGGYYSFPWNRGSKIEEIMEKIELKSIKQYKYERIVH